MLVKDLIEVLSTMPQDKPVFHVWDGAARTEINRVWVARSGNVLTSDIDAYVYDDCDRTLEAPTEKETICWRVK